MKHEVVEKNVGLMIILTIVALLFGTLVELVPLMFGKQVNEPISGLKPLPALELEGRDIYIREGCNTCHSQISHFRAGLGSLLSSGALATFSDGSSSRSHSTRGWSCSSD